MKKYSQEWWLSIPPEKVGKETEKLVESLFTEWNKSQDFAWHRLPDAKSARGALKAQPADFMFMSKGTFGFVEVKALKHEYRLPRDRLSQLPTLKKWSLAGACSLILVFHYTIGKWRVLYPGIPADVTSWDLSKVEAYDTLETALLVTGYF